MSSLPLTLLEYKYEKAAEDYLRSLPLEHFMESKAQAYQRKITVESLDLVQASRSDVHVFNEMLVQYPLENDDRKLGQVVPDNMVVVSAEPPKATGSFNLPLEPSPPFWMLEYVSKNNKRKDYEDNFAKYEQELKTPYYLLFEPDVIEMNLFRRNDEGRYVSVLANENGRFAIAELDLEVALLDNWVRYWHHGQLLPLPADLLEQLREAEGLLADARQRAEKEAQRADIESQRAEQQAQRAEKETQRAEQQAQRAAKEKTAREAAEAEVAELRAELEALRQQGRE